MIGDHGKGITEYYNIPVSLLYLDDMTDRRHCAYTVSQAKEVDILVGSMANGLASGGGFVAGSNHVCTHQVSRPPVSYQPTGLDHVFGIQSVILTNV